MTRGDEQSLVLAQFRTESRFTLFPKLLKDWSSARPGVEEKQAEERLPRPSAGFAYGAVR